MKQLVIFYLFLLSISCRCIAQNQKSITISFNQSDFEYVNENGVYSIYSNIHQLYFDDDSLTPAIPYVVISVLIDNNLELTGILVDSVEILIQSDVKIRNNVEGMPIDATLKTSPSSILKKHLQTFPTKSVEYLHSSLSDGYKQAHIKVYPFRYDVQEKQLFLQRELKLKLILNDSRVPVPLSSGKNMRRYIMDTSINANEMDMLYPIQETANRSNSENYDYLIVTNNALSSSFQTLANWKTTKGIRTKLLTIEQIYANNAYQGPINQYKIKKAIKDYYENHGTKYVLLAGDIEVVPSLFCFIQKDTITNTTPCDWYYACLGTLDWDSNENNVYGEVGDSVDIDPELFVSRISVSSNQEANMIVDRIVSYECNPDTTDWQDNILMAGCKLFSNYQGLSDAQYQGNILFHDSIMPFWNGAQKRFYDTYTDFGGANFQLNPTNMLSVLSNGYSLINMDTHGRECYWHLEVDSFTNTHATQFVNPRRSLIVTTACLTNAFDQPVCLSEAFMRNINSGILGYFGCSRQGWGSIMPRILGPSNLVNGSFFHLLLNNADNHFGEAAIVAKRNFVKKSQIHSMYRWLIFGINPLGDPEMPFLVSRPQALNSIQISFENGTLSVFTGRNDTKISITSSEDYGESYYYTLTDTCSLCLQPPIDNFTICVTAPGYIPYISTIINATYIQNQTITTNQDIANHKIMIGRDVTPTFSEGPVDIVSGETILRGSQEVVIKNSFTVHLGAKFIVNP